MGEKEGKRGKWKKEGKMGENSGIWEKLGEQANTVKKGENSKTSEGNKKNWEKLRKMGDNREKQGKWEKPGN